MIADLGSLMTLRRESSRAINAENPTGEPGRGGIAASELGPSRKGSPCLRNIPSGETVTLADIDGPGCIRHIWITVDEKTTDADCFVLRDLVLRFYWDDESEPSVECPLGDFFCCGWQEYMQISSLAVCVNPGSAFNCYWTMPFRRRCRMTLENRADDPVTMYYQIDYTLTDVGPDCAYFHAQFRRVDPLPYKGVYTILDGVRGKGQYVGTYMAWGVNNAGWWGEGEIKFYMDGDREYPTICGTGTEDYFCGSYNFEDPHTHRRYVDFTTPYGGFVCSPAG